MMNNICYSKSESEVAARIDAAPVGVFAWRARDGAPRACAVSPYRDGRDAVVTSTLALLGKVHAVRRDSRVALLAGGVALRGEARVELDRDGAVFDARLRAQELRKFPPSRSLLSLPFHRCLLWWYVGRVIVRLPLAGAEVLPGDDRATIVVIGADGFPRIDPLAPDTADWSAAQPGSRIALGSAHEGRALVLVHEEHRGMTELRQLCLHGRVDTGGFRVERRLGSLAPAPRSALGQLAELRQLAVRARCNRPVLDAWNGAPLAK